MRIYLDDDLASPLLARLLRRPGHDVQLPADVGFTGKSDAVHLTHAMRDRRICLSRNYQDFEHLHLLVLEAQGHHPGILVVRMGRNPKQNMALGDIVKVLRNLENAGVPLTDEYYILNHWQ